MDLTSSDGNTISVANATFFDFMNYYDVNLDESKGTFGDFLGSMMAFLFCGLTMNAVGRLPVTWWMRCAVSSVK